jgi:CIC family chloride channel protein
MTDVPAASEATPTRERGASAGLQWLRSRARASDGWFIACATLVGVLAGIATWLLGGLSHWLQGRLFHLEPLQHLSAVRGLSPGQLMLLPLGGLCLGGFSLLVRAHRRRLVDAVEANALHGGAMSMRYSLVVSGQTVLSNGFGASVGLEAAYAQMGGGFGSQVARWLRLRRADSRTLVGAGAGAAIGAAFGAPLTGAFYAFEIVIGAYSPQALAPVAAASIAAVAMAATLGVPPYLLSADVGTPVRTLDYPLFVVLGLLCAVVAIALMRAVTAVERGVGASRLPRGLRPALGGLLLVPLAMTTPQVLSGGHGALGGSFAAGAALSLVALVFAAKSLASIVSLGFGFRGGLFFASLLLGALVGHMFADAMDLLAGRPLVDPADAALVGMAALASGVVGGPLTMSMLLLEATRDFGLTSAGIAAVLVSSTVVRQMFGYSFSTWRFHLRGETIRSARDVGWMRSLNAERMMRPGAETAPAAMPVAEFRKRFPLGSTNRVVLLDAAGRYANIVGPAAVFADAALSAGSVGEFAGAARPALSRDAGIREVMLAFDAARSDELAVVDADGRAIGVLSEAFARKRYAEELENRQREMLGERL